MRKISYITKSLLISALIMSCAVMPVNAKQCSHGHYHVHTKRIIHRRNYKSEPKWIKAFINATLKRLAVHAKTRTKKINKEHHSHKKAYSKYGNKYNSSELAKMPDGMLWPLRHSLIRKTQNQLNYWTLRYLNSDRTRYNLAPLKRSYKLTKLAQIRAIQSSHNFTHTDSQGIPYDADDAHKVGINRNVAANLISENLVSSPLGASTQDNDPTHYYCKDGHDLAYEDNNSMLNYDNDDEGHRLNILDDTSHNVGIASHYNTKDNNFYLAEEFE